MADAGISVVTVKATDIGKTVLPVVRVFCMEIHNLPDKFCVSAFLRDTGKPLFQNCPDIFFNKCRTDAGGNKNAPVNPVAVMGHARRFRRKGRRLTGIPRADQSPGVDENLPPNLLRHSAAVLLTAPASWRGNAMTKV